MARPSLISPHGGRAVDLVAGAERADALRATIASAPVWSLTPRQACDFELLTNGGFAPLSGYMTSAAVDSVARDLRLPDGTLWPLPVLLDVDSATAARAEAAGALGLIDGEGTPLGLLHVEEVYAPDREGLAEQLFGTLDRRHPGVVQTLERQRTHAVGGRVEALRLPRHYDFVDLRLTPAQLRARFEQLGWSRIVAFQTRNPMHRVHFELSLRAARDLEANLLIHPVVGPTRPGDVDPFTRVRCYKALLPRAPRQTTQLALLPLAMRMAGPREAVLHALIRQNYGCSHFIVGRDHAGPGNDSQGEPFYGPFEAQQLLARHADEIEIEIWKARAMVYVRELDEYVADDEVPDGLAPLHISGSELRQRLDRGGEIPEWLTWPEVATELRRSRPPRPRAGFTVFLTGLSGAGKSTIANVLQVRFREQDRRPVTLLDGDIVRRNLSSELGFSKEHRDLNIRRIGFVASEITKNGGIAICAPIAPYDHVRREVREAIEDVGGFALVHVATPLATCEARDPKGLYAKARAGEIRGFTGIDDPYEVPTDAELVLDTRGLSPEAAAQRILLHLEGEGYLGPESQT
ncbi:MAG: bifunctional sulfate adenylyltransferase/adenylylsulfate kinase [Acidobacteriota bacterium]